MQQKYCTILTLLFLFQAITGLFAQYTFLNALDPRRGNNSSQKATIEDAAFVIRPKGIYAAVDVYLTFSARGTNFAPGDSLEIVFDFGLPTGSIVNDSWLWVEDQIVKADILDVWTASTIYENIVQRRQDPSILTKGNNGYYKLRIFPLLGNGTRRVKISYLSPLSWSETQASLFLPMTLIRPSRFEPERVEVRTEPNTEWGNPVIVEAPNKVWDTLSVANLGTYLRTDIKEFIQTSTHINFTPPLQSDLFVSTFQKDNSGVYQLVFFPEKVFDLPLQKKKILLVIDYVNGNTNDVGLNECLNGIQSTLLASLSPSDSFNIVFSQLNPRFISDTWIPATPEAVHTAFTNLAASDVGDYSNMPALLGAGLDFIKSNGDYGDIVIAANTNGITGLNSTNQLINDIRNEIGERDIKVHIFDAQNRNLPSYNIGGRGYRGNEYFYINLTQLTGGHYGNIRTGNFSFGFHLGSVFEAAASYEGFLDVHTTLQKGFCHSRYNPLITSDLVNFKRSFVQVGKYEGDFPMEVQVTGQLDGVLFNEKVIIDQSQVFPGDSLTQQMWSGAYVADLEATSTSNLNITHIINESINERVLSRYTAFLCLEPNRGGQICLDCVDESETLVDVEEVVLDSLVKISTFPNPFHERVTIVLEFYETTDLKNFEFAVYNLAGQQVHRFADVADGVTNRLELTWDAAQEVASGVYLFVIQTPQGRYTSKLVKF